jgi:hypothetical protein
VQVDVPMRWWTPSEYCLTRLLKFAFLTDEQIRGLPGNLPQLAHHDLSSR